MSISLETINAENWREVIKLAVEPEQERFVAPNLYSIAQARIEPWWELDAIRAGETLVGFTMYGLVPAEGCYWICRLMIDREHQGRGYGRAAMVELLGRLRSREDCSELRISFVPENVAARDLYLSLGFEDRGLMEDGEVVLVMPVKRAGAVEKGA
jgi:diamine N-acetyltransferase